MNHSPDPLFDSRIADWLEEDPNTAPDQALATVLAAVPSISQRHRLVVPWRLDRLSIPLRLATAAVIAVVVLGAIYLYLPGRNDVGPPSPTPTPTWQTYTSQRFQYEISRPGDFIEVTAIEELPDDLMPGVDSDYAVRFDAPVTHSPYLVVTSYPPEPPKTVAQLTAEVDELIEAECDILATEPVSVPGPGHPTGVQGELLTVRCLLYGSYEVHLEHDGRFVVIAYKFAPTRLEAERPAFDRILASFSFTN